jgi:hypothetical protein
MDTQYILKYLEPIELIDSEDPLVMSVSGYLLLNPTKNINMFF